MAEWRSANAPPPPASGCLRELRAGPGRLDREQLETAHAPRRLHFDGLASATPGDRLAHGGVDRDPPVASVGLARPDELVLDDPRCPAAQTNTATDSGRTVHGGGDDAG